jgi:hypothetical protein
MGQSELQPTGGVVTFMDVLGWRGIYQRKPNPLADLEELVSGLGALHDGSLHRVPAPRIKGISDTIAVFSLGDEEEWPDLINYHGFVAAVAIARGINYEMPIRGATSVGDFQLSENMFVGRAIDEAAGWYEKADWIGVHLTPSADFAFEPDERSYWVRYMPPLPGAPRWPCPCANWSHAWGTEKQDRESLLRIFRTLGPITPDISNKYINALKFYDEMQDRLKDVV